MEGHVLKALLFTDIVGSTRLSESLGDARWAAICARLDERARTLRPADAVMLERTDGFLIAFDRPAEALRFAFAWHAAMGEASKEEGIELATRAAIHLGELVVRRNPESSLAAGEKPLEMDGLALAQCARAMSLAIGGQTLLTREAFNIARRGTVGDDAFPPTIKWLAHGPYLFKGVEEPVDIFEAGIEGEAPLVAPRDSEKAHRVLRPGEENLLGWRPALGQEIKRRPGWFLEAKIGEGGFGEVWLARNERTREPRVFKFCFVYERLKSLKRELTLFLLIKEVLGQRPDIQRLYDLNFDEPPYFLEMDYACGGDLVAWSEAKGGLRSVPLGHRLEIVAQVAQAVSAAHSIAILHKDVKPQNILIDEDAVKFPQAKLTDFGIGQLADKSILERHQVKATGFTASTLAKTELSSRTGTRLYMAPELFVDKPPSIQSDIYALGVLLYQMIVGDFACAVSSDWEKDVPDPLLKEDLRLCLAGDPAKRLASARELAQRLRTLPQRRRTRRRIIAARVATFASIILALLLGVSVWWLNRERERANLERGLREEAEARQTEAELNLAIARAQGDGAYQVIDFVLRNLKEAMDEELTVDRGITIPVANEISHAIAGHVAAPIVDYFQTLDTEAWPAELQLKNASRMFDAGGRFREMGRYAESLQLTSPTLDLRESLLGPNHPDTATSLNDMALLLKTMGDYKEALRLYERALAIREVARGPKHPDTALSLSNLAALHFARGDYKAARPLLERALSIREEVNGLEDSDTSTVLHNLASLYAEQGDVEEAKLLFVRAFEIAEKSFGPDDPETIASLEGLGTIYRNSGDLEAARRLYSRVLEKREISLGPNHPATAISLNNLAGILRAQGDVDSARRTFERALSIQEKAFGPEHSEVAATLNNLALLHKSIGDYTSAIPFYQRALLVFEKAYGPNHSDTVVCVHNLASTLQVAGDYEAAQQHFERALAALSEIYSPEHPKVATCARSLFGLHVAWARREAANGRVDLARQHALSAIDVIGNRTDLLESAPRARAHYAEVLTYVGRSEDAKPMVERLISEGYPGKDANLKSEDREAVRSMCIQFGLEPPTSTNSLDES